MSGAKHPPQRRPLGPRVAPCLLVGLALVWVAASAVAADRPSKRAGSKSVAQQPRMWSDASGKYKIRATLVEVEDEEVRLRRTSDGKVIRVPIEKLSEADQNWLKKFAAASESAPAETEGEWPGWLGPNRDGKSPDTGLLKQWSERPRLIWRTDILGRGFSSVAVARGTVYATGETDRGLFLYAFDNEGRLKWKAAHGPAWTANYPGARSTPTIDGNNLYLFSAWGTLGCFDAQTGKPKWARSAKEFGGAPGSWGYAESPLVYGPLVVFKPGGRTCIVALDKATGRDVWVSRGLSAGPEYGSCLAIPAGNDAMIVTGTRQGLVCVDARSGRLLWGNDFSANNTANCPTPAYADGHVFWANGYGKGGICFRLGPGGMAAEAWRTEDMDCHHGGYIIDKGHIYGNNGTRGWTCLELKTGQKKWTASGVGKGSLCWADGMLYLFGEKGGQCALATCSPEGLELKGSLKVEGDGPSWAHPVVIGGRLYLRYDTNLYCFDVKTGPKADAKEKE